MQDDIKIELRETHTALEGMRWVDLRMTNKKGTQYRVTLFSASAEVRYVHNVTNDRHCTMKNAPKWVQKTIEEQLPVVAIILS